MDHLLCWGYSLGREQNANNLPHTVRTGRRPHEKLRVSQGVAMLGLKKEASVRYKARRRLSVVA
jgi:hypothetical protein